MFVYRNSQQSDISRYHDTRGDRTDASGVEFEHEVDWGQELEHFTPFQGGKAAHLFYGGWNTTPSFKGVKQHYPFFTPF